MGKWPEFVQKTQLCGVNCRKRVKSSRQLIGLPTAFLNRITHVMPSDVEERGCMLLSDEKRNCHNVIRRSAFRRVWR